MRTLIQNGTIVTASDTFQADLLVENEKVALIGQNLASVVGNADSTIDAKGKFVMPGAIDVHTHLDMPFGGTTSADDFESGTIAAAAGGTTTVIDFAIQPKGGGLREGLEIWHGKAEGKSVIDYGFHMIIREIRERTLLEMDALTKEEGCSSFKLFTAYPGVFMVDDQTLFRALLRTGENGSLISMHCENGNVIDVLVEKAIAEGKLTPKWHALTRPASLEAEATHRVITLADVAKVPIYIVHLSAAEALHQLKEAQDRGVMAFAETCPQYLLLDDSHYDLPDFQGAKYVMSPPLRPAGNEKALWQGLKSHAIHTVATDHCPFHMNQKRMGEDNFAKIPNGAASIETRLLVTWDRGVRTGKITMNRFVDVMSTTPAKIFGIYGKKGTLAVGADADIVVWDPNKEHTISAATHHMRVDNEPYEGWKVTGAPALTMSRGKVIVAGGKFVGQKGHGRYLKRGPLQAGLRSL